MLDRILERIEFDTNGGCWLWARSLLHNGYGHFSTKQPGRTRRAHRLAYEAVFGPIPAGAELDHKCRVRCCCNPAHLEPVTREENIARGNAPHIVNSRRTHCVRGHEFTPENTYINRRGNRECRACWPIRMAHAKAKRAAPIPSSEDAP